MADPVARMERTVMPVVIRSPRRSIDRTIGYAARCLVGVLLSVCGMTSAAAEALAGHVTEVVDGDTLRVALARRGQAIVRLAWIDAPNRLQEHGEAARASLMALSLQKAVRLDVVGETQGTLRATVWVTPQEIPCRSDDCPKTLDLGHVQIARGMAWHDRRSLGQPAQAFGQYEHAEFEAKLRRIGLWAAKNPTPPWDWRPR